MKQFNSNCQEEDLLTELVDEGPIAKNKISINFVRNSNPLVANKGKSRFITHQPYESNDFGNGSPSGKDGKVMNKSFEIPSIMSISIPVESNKSVNKFVDSEFIDSIIDENKVENDANKGVELFLKIQKESSEHIMSLLKKINSDKRLLQFRRSLVKEGEDH